jgi:hypothetical protein
MIPCGSIILRSSLRKFCGCHHDMVNLYIISVSQIAMDIVRLSQSQSRPPFSFDNFSSNLKQELHEERHQWSRNGLLFIPGFSGLDTVKKKNLCIVILSSYSVCYVYKLQVSLIGFVLTCST